LLSGVKGVDAIGKSPFKGLAFPLVAAKLSLGKAALAAADPSVLSTTLRSITGASNAIRFPSS